MRTRRARGAKGPGKGRMVGGQKGLAEIRVPGEEEAETVAGNRGESEEGVPVPLAGSRRDRRSLPIVPGPARTSGGLPGRDVGLCNQHPQAPGRGGVGTPRFLSTPCPEGRTGVGTWDRSVKSSSSSPQIPGEAGLGCSPRQEGLPEAARWSRQEDKLSPKECRPLSFDSFVQLRCIGPLCVPVTILCDGDTAANKRESSVRPPLD